MGWRAGTWWARTVVRKRTTRCLFPMWSMAAATPRRSHGRFPSAAAGTQRSSSASRSGSHVATRPVIPRVAKSIRRRAPNGFDTSARRPADHSFARFPIRNPGGSVWSRATNSRSSVYDGAVLTTVYSGGSGLRAASRWTVRCSTRTVKPSARIRATSPPANGFSNHRPSNSFWDVKSATRAGTSSFVAARTVTSMGSPGRHLDPAVVHDHRVLCLRDDPAARVEEGLVRHDPPRPEEPAEVRGGLPVQGVRPPLREREALEGRVEPPEELVHRAGGDLAGAEDPVDVPGLFPLHLPRAVRRERLDRDRVPGLHDVVPEPAPVRDRLPRVEVIPLDRVAGQVRDRFEPVALDRPLDRGPQDPGRGLRAAHLDRGLQCDVGGLDQVRPVPGADLHGHRGVCDVPVHLGPEVELHDVPPL